MIFQKKFFTSELFKIIQDAILLILHYRTLSLFRTVSSSTFIMSDVQSIYIPSSTRDWYQEAKFWAKDRRYSFCMWILWTKNTKILRQSTWKQCFLHNTCRQRGRNIKTRVFARHQTSSKERIKVLSKTIERYHSSRNTSSLLYSESWPDGNWSSHTRKSTWITSAVSEDFLEK